MTLRIEQNSGYSDYYTITETMWKIEVRGLDNMLHAVKNYYTGKSAVNGLKKKDFNELKLGDSEFEELVEIEN